MVFSFFPGICKRKIGLYGYIIYFCIITKKERTDETSRVVVCGSLVLLHSCAMGGGWGRFALSAATRRSQ